MGNDKALNPLAVETVHNGYFAVDKSKPKDSSESRATKADDEAYNLIMRDKERLLSMTEPLTKTPEELIGAAYEQLHATLRNDLMDLVKKMDPFLFEHLVIDLLVAMGYGGSREEAARVTKASGDEGIDGVINEDRLGLDILFMFRRSVGKTRWVERKFKVLSGHSQARKRKREFSSQRVVSKAPLLSMRKMCNKKSF